MNAFKMNQIAFSQPGVTTSARVKLKRQPKAWSLFPPRTARQVSKKPSNASIFLISFLTYLIGIFPSIVYALPSGGTVQAGSATIDSVSSQQLIIQQTTDKAIIDWQAFGIESTEHVDFQLSQGGVTLNRVTGNDPSSIFGKLTSNGDLWLINPNGVLFGSNAQVDVNGLIATTSNISNADFLNGNYNFSVPSSLSSTVVNQGIITAAEGGLVAFVAPGVQNMGIINARLGKVSLASGKTFTVDLYGDQLINLGVDSQVMGQVTGINGQALTSLVSNSGSIFADGGVVRLDVNAAQNIVDRVINMDGVIQARSVVEKNGQIILMGGEAGEVSVSGTLDASGYGQGETGGTVHVLGDMLDFSGNGFIDVSGDLGGGTLLFGGDYQGQGSVPNATDSYIGPDTQTFADAVTSGNGGKIIFWADRRMRFYGIVRGRGGQYFGDGGLVEVSGKEELYFDGSVDTTAPNGKTGTLLLDPDTITIADGSGST
ncbi:MAG: filamentous hemagglutinin N-terminal domain-containing protein, partial [Nitrospina sp.]|nr:filamentous hemagglutinin N-terminal domain-containing protein [Nitrospina sp.]